MHARHGKAEGDRAEREPHAALPGKKYPQSAIGGADGDQHRNQHHHLVVMDVERTGKSVNADIVHRDDAGTEQQRRGDDAAAGGLADGHEEQ